VFLFPDINTACTIVKACGVGEYRKFYLNSNPCYQVAVAVAGDGLVIETLRYLGFKVAQSTEHRAQGKKGDEKNF